MNVPIIIDFEASGFGKDSYPIEVGFISPEGKVWCCLIKPEPDWRHWDVKAENIHHVSREDLLNHGNSAQVVAEQLNSYLENCDVYSDAWFYDYVWLAKLFDAAHITPTFQLKDLRQIITSEQQISWDATKLMVLQELQLARHRASSDAWVLQLTWLRTLQLQNSGLYDKEL